MIKHDRVTDGRHLMEQEIASLAGLPSVCVTINGAEFARLFDRLAEQLATERPPGIAFTYRMLAGMSLTPALSCRIEA